MKKNLIILCTDQMRGDCLGANGRNPDIRTPNLDALAQRGVNFRQHYATFPKCVPARVSLMTGRYGHTDGYRTITQHMPFEQPDLLGTMLRAGYRAALFGKNHCWENLFEATHRPSQLKEGQRGHKIDHHSWTAGYADIYNKWKDAAEKEKADAEPNPNRIKVSDLKTRFEYAGRRREAADEAYTEQAIHFLENGVSGDQPFFLQVNIEKPHTPYGVEEPWFSMYDRKTIRQWPSELPEGAPLPYVAQRNVRTGHDIPEDVLREIQATYMGAVSKVDHLMGRIIHTIERLGLFENTVVVLWSDHGDFAGQYGLVEKWDTIFSDSLLNVPFVICAPSLPKGKTVDALTDHTDIAPTLMELLGLDPLPGVHGESLVPVVAGGRARSAVFADGGHEDEMIARFQHQPLPTNIAESAKQATYREYPDSMARAKMIRTATHKLVTRTRGGNELYDLVSDPWEMINRYDDPAFLNVKSDLQQQLLEWCLRTDTDRPFQEHFGA